MIRRATCGLGARAAAAAPAPAPCAIVDRGPSGKGWVVALFDTRSNALKGFLSVKDGDCGSVRERSAAASFRTAREAEAAAKKCRAAECPP